MEDYYEEEIINYGSCPGIRIICGRMLIEKRSGCPDYICKDGNFRQRNHQG